MIYRYIAVFCVLLSSANSQFGTTQCSAGAECVVIQSCPGLYNQLLQGATPSLTKILRGLHCGFQDQTPMICCPPLFKGTGSSNNVNPPSNQGGSNSILPDFSSCGIQEGNKIVGGTQTELDEHPWMALLRYDKPSGFGFYCGGVLIAKRYVLTAGHCVKGKAIPTNYRLTQVRLGEWNTQAQQDCDAGICSEPPVDIDIEEAIVHEGYSGSNQQQPNDIALLRLAKSVKYSYYIQPICLPTTNELKSSNYIGFRPEVVGWGKTETRSESDVKLKVAVPVVSNAACSNVYGSVGRTISANQICAGGESGQDSCRGDSGGPLIVQTASQNWVAIGVVSYGPTPCGTLGWPGVYTRVGAYMDWILSKLRE